MNRGDSEGKAKRWRDGGDSVKSRDGLLAWGTGLVEGSISADLLLEIELLRSASFKFALFL
jgi:hypothetical protein